MQNILAKGVGSDSTGATSLIDTRLLGKPSRFSGDTDAEGRSTDGILLHTWSFTTRAYAAAMAPRMSALMKDAASMSESPDDVSNEDLGDEDTKHSITLYFVIALLVKGKTRAWTLGSASRVSSSRRSQVGSGEFSTRY